MSSLLQPVVHASNKLQLRNRIAMASLTRNRTVYDYKPGQEHVKHYADRARNGAGLIVTEGTFVDWTGGLWQYSPFMITPEHAQAWRPVTDAVHAEGGKIFMQAWHAGRAQNDATPLMKAKGGRVLAPSAVPADGGNYRYLPGNPVCLLGAV
jgi:2,4-dienoyl-CoA reductase-like NADH-dependent reductase (Old Yellow Enzyme family)